MNYTYEYCKEELAKSHARLHELRKEGINALSRYDIAIAHGGNATLALRTAKQLVSNHIKWWKKQLTELSLTPIQQALF